MHDNILLHHCELFSITTPSRHPVFPVSDPMALHCLMLSNIWDKPRLSRKSSLEEKDGEYRDNTCFTHYTEQHQVHCALASFTFIMLEMSKPGKLSSYHAGHCGLQWIPGEEIRLLCSSIPSPGTWFLWPTFSQSRSKVDHWHLDVLPYLPWCLTSLWLRLLSWKDREHNVNKMW